MADIEAIRKKIDKLISEKGLNYRDVSLKIGRKDSYMQQYVRYRYPRRLKEIDRIRLAQLLGIDDTEIMDDEIMVTKSARSIKTDNNLITNFTNNHNMTDDSMVRLNILKSRSDTADKADFLKDSVGTQCISKNIFEDMTSAEAENISIIKITSDSMKPSINAGDIVWIDTSYDIPSADGLYLFLNGNEPSVKRVQISPIDGSVEINCSNSNYKSYTTDKAEKVKVLGKVIYLMQKV